MAARIGGHAKAEDLRGSYEKRPALNNRQSLILVYNAKLYAKTIL